MGGSTWSEETEPCIPTFPEMVDYQLVSDLTV